jgi:hypothetical protein
VRRISIVFAETGDRKADGHHTFSVFLESADGEAGLTRLNNVPEDQLSSAEWWAKTAFEMVAEMVTEAGALKEIQRPS